MYYASPFKVFLESFNTLKIETDQKLFDLKFEHRNQITQLDVVKTEDGYQAVFDFELDLQSPLFVHLNCKYKQHIEIGMITTTSEFDQKYSSDLQLGALYTPLQTTFRVWSPVATKVILVLADSKFINMTADGRHYSVTVGGDLEAKEYYYLVEISGQLTKVIDPYALNLTVNTEAGIIIDRHKIEYTGNYNQNDKSKMVIYETSVCDFTSDINLDFEHKGKFLGFSQSKTIASQPIGLDYVVDLGITHLQLMPLYDFGSVDEQTPDDCNYNWGYDPVHYNVPEGSYAVKADGYSRILECKQMISDIKARGIGVIIDIVYNHVYDASTFNFNQLVPNYFFRFTTDRQYSNGSFCGNEVASERQMVRRYIIDTLKTWQRVYGVDGVRIDLMGLIDIDTIKAIETEMSAHHPNFIIYGEGWNMEGMLPRDSRAAQINADKLPNVGHFNDDLRNFIKGDNSDFDKIGYVQGNYDKKSLEIIQSGKPLDSSKKYVNEFQIINYLSCHDDHTLYDYLKINQQDEAILTEQIIEAYELMFASAGIPFIHSGCEFKRTKNGQKNTYNKSRQLNAIKWNQILENKIIISTIKDLIARRK